MNRIFSSPKKSVDVSVTKLFAKKNITPFAKRVCGLIPGNGFHTQNVAKRQTITNLLRIGLDGKSI